MALAIRRALCLNIPSPIIEIKRFRGKINLRKPQKPHFVKALYTELTKPKFESKYKGKAMIDLCAKLEPKPNADVDNPYERIIARELLDYLKRSRLVAFFHKNPIRAEDHHIAHRLFKKSNIDLVVYGKTTMKIALEGTPYEALLPFYVSHNAIAFSTETNIKKLLQITKKFPQLILLAGILDGRLVSKDELVHYSAVPNLQAAQAGLVHTLNSIGGQIVSQLNSHQTTLVSHLQERAKQLEEK